MKSFKQHIAEANYTSAVPKGNPAEHIAGVEIIMGATKNAKEAEKEVAKVYKVSPAEAKKLVQQVIKKASKDKK